MWKHFTSYKLLFLGLVSFAEMKELDLIISKVSFSSDYECLSNITKESPAPTDLNRVSV